MYHADPLSASIIPYFFIARKMIWFVAEYPEMSKLARSRNRAPIGGYLGSVRLEA